MSWIFGIIRKNKQAFLPKKEDYPYFNKGKFVVETKEYYFSCGLGHNNSFFKYDKDKDAGWMVCGTGISYNGGSFHLMNFQEWEDFLKNKNSNIRGLNGHFVIVEWEQGNLKIRNDQLGMRDMYITENSNYIAFSTRIDRLLPFVDSPDFDFKTYSSSWLCINLLSPESIISNTRRLGPGGKATTSNKIVYKNSHPWLPPTAKEIPRENYLELISKLTNPEIDQKRKLILGLSGGIESRILLSILLNHNKNGWATYTFGEKDHPDLIIAKKLKEELGFNHYIISNLSHVNNEIEKFQGFVLRTHTFMLGTLFYEHEHYHQLDKNYLLIDGAKGEYCIRSFAKWLCIKGKKAILEKDTEKIIRLISHSKPKIFAKEILAKMRMNCQRQIEKLIDELPDVREIGIGNWVDYFTLRTRTGNMGHTTQTRLDEIIGNYMPFLQPSFLREVFKRSSNYRSQTKVYRSIFKKGNVRLMQIPIVKDECIIPFSTNSYLKYIAGKIGSRTQNLKAIDYSKLFLERNKNYVMDTLRSNITREYSNYNFRFVTKMVEGYYSGENIPAKDVIWWLTFDVWRRTLQENRKKLDS